MYFWTHTERESESETSHSKRNSHEAKEITRVAKTFCQDDGVPPSKITVLCSYRGQVSVTLLAAVLSWKIEPGSYSNDVRSATLGNLSKDGGNDNAAEQ